MVRGLQTDADSLQPVKWMDLSKSLLEIWRGGGENPFETVELDADSGRYIDIKINNVEVTYKDGEMVEKTHSYPLR